MSDDSEDPVHLVLALIETWGDSLCAWCLGVSLEELEGYRQVFAEVPEPVERSARLLAEVGEAVLSESFDRQPVTRHAAALGYLSRISPGRKHTPLNVIRLAAGGTLPSIDDEDDLVAAARWLGRDVLPCYLYLDARVGGPDHERDRDALELGRRTLFEGAGHDHPALDAFEAASSKDPRFGPLHRVFATERILVGTKTVVSGSAYLSGDALPETPLVRASDVPRALVEAAWDRQLLLGDPDPAAALDRLPALLDELARGLGGAQIAVPACVGLRGLALPAGGEAVTLRGGMLRPPTQHELRRTGGDDPVWLVLQLRLKSRLEVSATAPGELWKRWREPPWSWLAEQAEAIALASALATDSDWPASVTIAWAAVSGPLDAAVVETAPGGRPEDPVPLSPQEALALTEWAARVKTHRTRLPGVAVRRAISALHERTLFADGLVDALISLESLFGGGASLRIQSACAWLLAPEDYLQRRAVFDRVEKLYRLRSGVVHGGKKIVGSDWQEAVGILRDVFRRLLTDRTDLLTGGKIGDRLLLGEPAPRQDPSG